MRYWNDNTSRKYKEAAADLILTRGALGGQAVVFGRVSCMKRKINCIMFDLATSKGGSLVGGDPQLYQYKRQGLSKGLCFRLL